MRPVEACFRSGEDGEHVAGPAGLSFLDPERTIPYTSGLRVPTGSVERASGARGIFHRNPRTIYKSTTYVCIHGTASRWHPRC